MQLRTALIWNWPQKAGCRQHSLELGTPSVEGVSGGVAQTPSWGILTRLSAEGTVTGAEWAPWYPDVRPGTRALVSWAGSRNTAAAQLGCKAEVKMEMRGGSQQGTLRSPGTGELCFLWCFCVSSSEVLSPGRSELKRERSTVKSSGFLRVYETSS